ncbi:MAG TPA: hypothetical protein H9671_01090 [Firmicutes bacterium]|nr:hypothetical protein [Bacillota bacterium]
MDHQKSAAQDAGYWLFYLCLTATVQAEEPETEWIQTFQELTDAVDSLSADSTLSVGYGMTFIRKQKKLFYTGVFGLPSLAMAFHAIFNLLIQSPYDWVGMLMPICMYLLFWVFRSMTAKKARV